MPVIVLTTTEPTLLLNPNNKRTKLLIEFQPINVDANNTGRVHIGYGTQPVATAAHVSQGVAMLQGDQIDEPKGGAPLDPKFKQSVWATSTLATQSILLEESVETTAQESGG